MEDIFGLYIGRLWDSGKFNDKVFKTKESAIQYLTDRGYIFDSQQGMYLTDDYFRDKTFEKRWAKILPVKYFDE